MVSPKRRHAFTRLMFLHLPLSSDWDHPVVGALYVVARHRSVTFVAKIKRRH